MFERLMRAAERAADGMSRRDFLGRLGGGAATLAAAVSGLAGSALAGGNRLVCDANSAGCAGQPEGSECWIDRGVKGRCAAARGSTTCYCKGGRSPR